MEVHKHMYLNLLLNQSPDVTLEGLIEAVRGLEERARNCYEDEFTRKLTSGHFVDIMLLDSCFILTFYLLRAEHYARDEHDPMLDSRHVLLNNVHKDLMLLENQVPLFILEQLYRIIIPSARPQDFSYLEQLYGINIPSAGPQDYLKLVILCLLDEIQKDQCIYLPSSNNHQVKHFVDLVLKCNLPSCNLPSEICQISTNNDRKRIELPSATELRKSGIKFKRGVSNCFLDLKFTNGVLEIPFLCVEDKTERTFRNLIAMEQCHGSSTSYITDYTLLIDLLIDTPSDVALLRSCGIIDNLLGSDKHVCQLFNNLNREMFWNHRKEVEFVEGTFEKRMLPSMDNHLSHCCTHFSHLHRHANCVFVHFSEKEKLEIFCW